jgi:oligosaccharide 4-alpha-D-glucosyltransferase
MTRISFLLAFILFTHVSLSQKAVRFTTNSGKFEITSLSNNIYKIVFKPNGYTKGENISDAVILQQSNRFVNARVNNDSVSINGKLVISGVVNGESKGFRFPLSENEMIFGGGERALPLNRRGYRLNLYNNPWYGYTEGADNLNYSVPFITSSNGYGLFFNNPSKGYLDIGKANNNILEYGTSSGEINVYVIAGDYQTVLQSYYKLTGTQPLPPRWAFGNLMSRFGYTSEAQVDSILTKMKEKNIPVDAVIFDLFWFGDSIKGTLGNLDWINKQKWPDPKKMITEFKKDGIQTLLVTEPFFVETSKNYQASKPYLAIDSANKPYYLTDFYFGRGGLIDIFRKDAQSWFWQFYKKQMNNGVEAWWGDLGEPEKHPSDLYHNMKDYGYKRLFKADEVHNIYGHTWTKMLYNFYAKEYPEKRLFSLNRSGFAGSQRYSIFPWTGDVSRSWSGLRAQLGVLLGMSMSGVPYVHSDAGGFAGGEGDNELYVRWLQFAACTPIFRPHGTALGDVDPTNPGFPSEAALIDTPYRGMAREVIYMRYAMLPYNYSLAYAQTKYGKPLMAPLYYYYPSDTTAVKIQDEFFSGENILAAPVLEKGAVTRTYYLPEGNWYDPVNSKFLKGKTWHTDSVTLRDMKMFMKEGGFIATDQRKQNAGSPNPVEVNMFYIPSKKSSSFQLYEDDGTGKNNIKNGKYRLINFEAGPVSNKIQTIKISSNGGGYAGSPSHKIIRLTIPFTDKEPQSVSVNKKKLNRVNRAPGKNEFSVTNHSIYIVIDVKDKAEFITIHW